MSYASTYQILDSREAAEYLRVSRKTLESWRCKQCGPKFFRMNKMVRYRDRDLNEFLEQHPDNERN
ncbi:helix-turn-helix domain-containing protein [Candidatus Nomurabacteria bacterium]|nr:helix-turn-helix domain-containing protein [Candidatus Nomurabacteria bacterium]